MVATADACRLLVQCIYGYTYSFLSLRIWRCIPTWFWTIQITFIEILFHIFLGIYQILPNYVVINCSWRIRFYSLVLGPSAPVRVDGCGSNLCIWNIYFIYIHRVIWSVVLMFYICWMFHIFSKFLSYLARFPGRFIILRRRFQYAATCFIIQDYGLPKFHVRWASWDTAIPLYLSEALWSVSKDSSICLLGVMHR